MWNPHRFHWLRFLFNSVSSKAARTSCVGFHLRHRHLSGVHPLFHQLRDQQTDLTDDDHTRQHNWHQNTCVQHCNLSLLIYPLVCSLRRITAASLFWNLLSISCKSQQITYSVLHRHTHPCFALFYKSTPLFFSTFTVCQLFSTDYGRIVALTRPLVNTAETTFLWDFFIKTAFFCKYKLYILHFCNQNH